MSRGPRTPGCSRDDGRGSAVGGRTRPGRVARASSRAAVALRQVFRAGLAAVASMGGVDAPAGGPGRRSRNAAPLDLLIVGSSAAGAAACWGELAQVGDGEAASATWFEEPTMVDLATAVEQALDTAPVPGRVLIGVTMLEFCADDPVRDELEAGRGLGVVAPSVRRRLRRVAGRRPEPDDTVDGAACGDAGLGNLGRLAEYRLDEVDLRALRGLLERLDVLGVEVTVVAVPVTDAAAGLTPTAEADHRCWLDAIDASTVGLGVRVHDARVDDARAVGPGVDRPGAEGTRGILLLR